MANLSSRSRIIGNDVILRNFDIDRRTGQLTIARGASLDVNHLNGENLYFSVEVGILFENFASHTHKFPTFIYFFQKKKLLFQASDGLYSTLCNVNITIRDVNNHAPMFNRDHFVTSIEENLPIGKKNRIHCFLSSVNTVSKIFYLKFRHRSGGAECNRSGYGSEC